jgi:hypothetical protein
MASDISLWNAERPAFHVTERAVLLLGLELAPCGCSCTLGPEVWCIVMHQSLQNWSVYVQFQKADNHS